MTEVFVYFVIIFVSKLSLPPFSGIQYVGNCQFQMITGHYKTQITSLIELLNHRLIWISCASWKALKQTRMTSSFEFRKRQGDLIHALYKWLPFPLAVFFRHFYMSREWRGRGSGWWWQVPPPACHPPLVGINHHAIARLATVQRRHLRCFDAPFYPKWQECRRRLTLPHRRNVWERLKGFFEIINITAC